MTVSPFLAREETALDGGATSTSFVIDRVYVEGDSFQYGAELTRNIIQVHERMVAADDPGAATVEAWFDFTLIDVIKVDGNVSSATQVAQPYKRRVWNIGIPMHPKDELLKYYSALNVGGGANRWSPTNLTGSYGMGARAAILPWTDLLIVTTVPGDGSYGIVLRGTPQPDGSSLYSVARPVFYDEDGDPFLADSALFKLAGEDDDVPYLRTHEGTVVPMVVGLVAEKLRGSGVGGVSFIFLGKGDYAGNIEFDRTVNKGESAAGLPSVLTNRFVGGEFPVTVQYMYGDQTKKYKLSSLHSEFSGHHYQYDSRALKGLSDWTDRAEELPAVYVDAHGTTVTPYLLPEDYWHTGPFTTREDAEAARSTLQIGAKNAPIEYRADGTWGIFDKKRDSWLPFAGQGQVVVKYGPHEMYTLREINDRGRAGILSRWGISEERVARSVLLVIEPPVQESIETDGWGITQNAARSNISGPNGTDLPLGAWQAAWLDNFPQGIADRLKVRPPSVSKDIPEDEINRLELRAFGKAKAKAKTRTVKCGPKDTATGDGEEDDSNTDTSAGTGKGGGGGGGSTKSSTNATDKTGGSIKVTKRTPKRSKPPQPVFLTSVEWDAKGYESEQFCRVSTQGDGYVIELNGGHEVMDRQVKYYWDDVVVGHFSTASTKRTRDRIVRKFGTLRTPGADAKAKSAVVAEIEYVYRHDALATFLGAQASVYTDSKGNLDRVRFNEDVTEEAMGMTMALSGYYPQAEAVKSRLNGLAA